MDMAIKPFFEDAESSYFDSAGMPCKPGRYEFLRYDGRKILYTLDFMEAEEGETPRLKVVRASGLADYPYPAHALNTLDGSWARWLGPVREEEEGADPAASAEPGAERAAEAPDRPE
jgi:hypothetical protein